MIFFNNAPWRLFQNAEANSKSKCEGDELRKHSSLLLEGDAVAAGAA